MEKSKREEQFFLVTSCEPHVKTKIDRQTVVFIVKVPLLVHLLLLFVLPDALSLSYLEE